MRLAMRNVFSDGGGGLPFKKRLEYIESTGTQWIDTGVFVTVDTGFEIAIRRFNSSSSGVFGCGMRSDQSSEGWTRYQLGRRDNMLSSTRLFWGIFSGNGYVNFTTIDYSGEHIFRYDPQIERFYVDDRSFKVGWDATGDIRRPTTSQSFYLFANHNWDGAINLLCSASCRSAKFYESNVLIRDFIPVIDLNGEPKMFDQVTQTYPTHYGSFVAGPDWQGGV